MTTTYPSAIDSFTRPASNQKMDGSTGGRAQTLIIDDLADAVEAVEGDIRDFANGARLRYAKSTSGLEETYTNVGNVTGNITIDWSTSSVQRIVLTGNTTVTSMTGFTNGKSSTCTLIVVQDATGGRTLTLTGVTYDTATTLNSAANAVTRIVIQRVADANGSNSMLLAALVGSSVAGGGSGTLITSAYKTADTSTTSTTLAADPHLTATVAANKRYVYHLVVHYDGGPNNDAGGEDIKVAMDVSGFTATTHTWAATGAQAGASAAAATGKWDGNNASGASQIYGTVGVGTYLHMRISGFLDVGATGGTLQFKWAKSTAGTGANATRVLKGSTLEIHEV